MSRLTLPSSLVGDVREIKGVEMAAMAEQADGGGSADGGFSKLVSACWNETLDPGPYTFFNAGDSKPAWNRVLKGDLIMALVGLRKISLPEGHMFEFDAHCDECHGRIPWEVNLDDLTVKKLPDTSIARLKANEDFEAMAKGLKLHYRLQTLEQEEPVRKFMKQMNRKKATLVDVLFGQVTRIDGIGTNDLRARWRFLSELSMGDLFQLEQEMEAQDCGLQTKIEVKCRNAECQWEQEINLPLLNRRFFALRKKRQTAANNLEQPDFCETSSEVYPLSGGGSSVPISGGASTGEVGTGG